MSSIERTILAECGADHESSVEKKRNVCTSRNTSRKCKKLVHLFQFEGNGDDVPYRDGFVDCYLFSFRFRFAFFRAIRRTRSAFPCSALFQTLTNELLVADTASLPAVRHEVWQRNPKH